MNLSRYKIAFGGALVVGLATLAWLLYLTSSLIAQIRDKEEKSAGLIINVTMKLSGEEEPGPNDFYLLVSDILKDNDYLPVILVDENGDITDTRNLDLGKPDSLLTDDDKARALADLKKNGKSIVAKVGDVSQTIYYGESNISKQLGYVRWIQFFAIALFAGAVYGYVSRVRRRERDGLWKGLALETAHQLGTPISALGAWRELLASGVADPQMVADEMQKDIERLNSVATRFSKVGSVPQLADSPLIDDVRVVVEYLRSRISKNVALDVVELTPDVSVPHEPTLIRWAVENLCRNAADAIDGAGSISVMIDCDGTNAIIDVCDTGKGMDAKMRRRVFDAGFSTKKRGWGIGLALVKRIASEYHKGRVFVKESKPGKGTTFRIELPFES